MIQEDSKYPISARSIIGVELDSRTFTTSQLLYYRCKVDFTADKNSIAANTPTPVHRSIPIANEAFRSRSTMKQDLTPSRRIQRQGHILHKRFIVLRLDAIKYLQHPNEEEHCLCECEFLCQTRTSSASSKAAKRSGRGKNGK